MAEVAAPYVYDRGYITLPLPALIFKEFPDAIDIAGLSLKKKTEFHVSLLALDTITRTLVVTAGVGEKETEDGIIKLFNAFVTQSPITLAVLHEDFRIAREQNNASLIVRCKLSNHDAFFQRLNTLYGTAIPIQPAHVTLYTQIPDVDIGITTDSQLYSLEMTRELALREALSRTIVR